MIRYLPRGALARSSLHTGGLLALRLLAQAAILLLLTRLLGPVIYGQLVAAASLAVVMGILASLGAGFVMMAQAPKHADAVATVWRYAWPLTLAVGLLLLTVYLPMARLLGGGTPLAWHVLVFLGVTELLCTPWTSMQSFALQASDRVPLSQFVQWLPLGLRVIAVLPCFLLDASQRLGGYAVLQLVAAVIGLLAGLLITMQYVRLDWRPRLARARELRQGASYAAMHLVAANPSEIDKIMAARLIGSHDAGIYAATSRAMGSVTMPVIAMLLAAQPRLFRYAAALDPQGKALIRLIAILALGWGLLCWLALTIVSPVLPWVFGKSFGAMALLMPWLAAVAAPLSLRFAAGTVLMTLGRPLERMLFELFGIATLLLGMFVFAPRMGMRGLASAMLLSETAMALLGWWLVRRNLRMQATAADRTSGIDPDSDPFQGAGDVK